MLQTIEVLAKFEGSQVGSQTDNIWFEYNNFSVAHGMIMSGVDCVWLTVLGLYCE